MENLINNQNAIDMMVFENPEFGKVRTILDADGEPLFCGKDVCDVLGYRKAYDAVKQHVNAHDTVKRGIRVETCKRSDGSPVVRCLQMLFVKESGFYALVFGSKMEGAQRFKHWVTSEVLPAIRKHGVYIIDQLLPKALYVDNVLDSVSCYTTTQIAKEIGCTAQELNRWLCALRVQYYQSGQYLLYADYAHRGLAKSRTRYKAVASHEDAVAGHAYTHTYLVWTERGRKLIHDLMDRMWQQLEVA